MAQAIVYSSLGGPEVLTLVDAPPLQAEPGRLVVRVEAAGVNPIDAKLRALPDDEYPEGREISTDAWSRTLRTGDHTIDLGLSTAFWQVTVALGALCFLGLRPWRATPAGG